MNNSILISFDGPDGAGKSTMAHMFVEHLIDYFGKDKVVLIKPTYFSTTKEAMAIERKMGKKRLKRFSSNHNLYYLMAMEVNYKLMVLPSLKSGKIVVLDSSEIRALAFNISKGCDKSTGDVIEWIRAGKLTCGVYPDVRVLLTGSVDEIWKNLGTKKKLDAGDPKTIKEVLRRKEAYDEALRVIKQLENKVSKDIFLEVRHVGNPYKNFRENIEFLIKEIFPFSP